MGSINTLHVFFNNSKKTIFRLIGAAIIASFLISCSDEIIRTEAEYIDVATEAHAKGDSRLALFELSAGIKNYPKNAELQLLRGKIFLDLEDGSAAEIAFNKAIALGYNRNNIKYDMAEAWLYQRNPDKIITVLEKDIQQGAQDALIYEILGRAYIAARDRSNPMLFMKNMNKAEDYIAKAYRLNPNSTRVLITKAWLLGMAGKTDKALEWLDKADKIVKDQRQNLAVKGELLVRQEKIDPAQDVYQSLVKKFPQYPQYKMELGYTYLLKSDYSKAREWIEPIAQKYPDQLRPKYLLANISLMEKKYEDAKSLSDEILARSPNYLEAVIINGASSFFLKDYENAHLKLKYFYNKTGSIQALKLLVATKLKVGEEEEAAKLLETSGQVSTEQTDSELLNLVAAASAKIGRKDVALAAYQKLAEQKPDSLSYKKNIALIQIAQGEYNDGFKNLEDALREEKSETASGQNFYILTNAALKSRQYDRAKSYIAQYKAIASDDYKPWIMSAVLQSLLKNYDGVREDFEKAIEVSPNTAEVKARYAIFESLQGNQEKALKLAKAALKLDPSDIGSGKLILGQLVKEKKYDEIKNIIDTAINNENASPGSKMIFADYYTLLGQPNETLKILKQSPGQLRKTVLYQITMGKALLRSGQTERSVDVFEDILLTHPENIQILKFLLRGYILMGNQRKYQSTLEKVDRLSPNEYANQSDLAKLYISTGKYDRAEKMLSAIKPDGEYQILQVEILKAGLETNRKNYKKALTILTPLIAQYPRNGTVNMLYARNLVLDDQLEKAIKITNNWANQHPDNMEAKMFLGDLYLRAKDADNAQKQYITILSAKDGVSKSTEIHAHNNLANIYMDRNELETAQNHARKALDQAPNDPAIIDTFAQVMMKQGKPEIAIDYFNQALALIPGNDRNNRSLFSFSKAKAMIQAGQKEQARHTLSRLIKGDPSFAKIDEVKQLLSDL